MVKIANDDASTKAKFENWLKEISYITVSPMFPFLDMRQEDMDEREGRVNLGLMYRIEVAPPYSSERIISQLNCKPWVKYAERLYNHEPLMVPNDPMANRLNGSQRDWLGAMLTYEAWEETTGDSTNQKIAFIDTGTQWNHPDLIGNLAINRADPINGVDDDRNGLIDDYRGWDFSDRDNNPIPGTDGHGTVVASIASARGNNGQGMAGIAFTTRFIPVRVFGQTFRGYDGIAYAASMGATVINLSWGRASGGPSQFEQDVLSFCVNNRNIVVTAAAGNTAGDFDFYPASYEGVISCIHTYPDDRIEPVSSSSYHIDLAAPGAFVNAIRTDGTYGFATGGSSFATPMVSGAAALVRSKFPALSARQVGEVLRVSSDNIYSVANNSQRLGKMGYGRVNIQSALSNTIWQSVRFQNQVFRSTRRGTQIVRGDTVLIAGTLVNMLGSVGNFSVTLESITPGVRIIDGVAAVPALPEGSNYDLSLPFKIWLDPQMSDVGQVALQLRYQGLNYTDRQFLFFNLSSGFLTLETGLSSLTLGDNGRIGYYDAANNRGLGFRSNGKNVLADGGVMIGINQSQVVNCVFDTSSKDNDFRRLSPIRLVSDNVAYSQSFVSFSDSNSATTRRCGLVVEQLATAYKATPANRAVILQYKVTNNSSNDWDSVCFGIYTDFDCGNFNNNGGAWQSSRKLGYTFSRDGSGGYAGVSLLTSQEPSVYFLDAVSGNVANRNLDITNGFSIAEKYATISQGLARPTAGNVNPTGNNVVQITGCKLRNLAAGQSQVVTFAMVAGENLTTLNQSLDAAVRTYALGRTADAPRVSNATVCRGGTLRITPENGQTFRFYANPARSVILGQGRYLELSNVRQPQTLFVTCLDSLFEGPASICQIEVTGPSASFDLPNRIGRNQTDSITLMPLQFDPSIMYRWQINGSDFSVSRTGKAPLPPIGRYNISLIATSNFCADSSSLSLEVVDVLNVRNQSHSAEFTLFPNPASTVLRIQFAITSLINSPEIEVVDNLGRVVLTHRIDNNLTAIPISQLPKGLYRFKLKDYTGIIGTKSFSKD